MFPPTEQPNHLNVPLPDPSALAPQPPDRMQQAMSLIAPLFALGSAFGGSPRTGAAFLHGAHQGIQQQTAERQAKEQQAQRAQLEQAKLAEAMRVHQEAEEAKRAAGVQKLVEDTALAVKGTKTRDEYESIIGANESLGGYFYGLPPNKLRAAVPYRAPKSDEILAAAGTAFLKNPINAKAIEDGNLNGVLMLDVQGDGVPVKVPIRDVLAKTPGVQIDPETGVPMLQPKGKPTNVQLDDEAFLGAVAKWEAEKGRKATQAERGEIALKIKQKVAAAGRAPATNVTVGPGMPGMSPQERVESAAQDMIAGRMAPSQLATFFTGMGKDSASQLRSLVMQRVKQLQPEYNFAEADTNFAFGKNTGTQNTIRFIDNIAETLPRLRASSANLKRTGVRMVNAAVLAAKRQFGDESVATFDTDRLILADEIAKVLQGGGTGSGTSDAKLKQAVDLLRGDMSVGQFDATLNEIEELLSTRRRTLSRGTVMEKKPSSDARGRARQILQQGGYDTSDATIDKFLSNPKNKALLGGGS